MYYSNRTQECLLPPWESGVTTPSSTTSVQANAILEGIQQLCFTWVEWLPIEVRKRSYIQMLKLGGCAQGLRRGYGWV